jgi:hypothetical protein
MLDLHNYNTYCSRNIGLLIFKSNKPASFRYLIYRRDRSISLPDSIDVDTFAKVKALADNKKRTLC